MSIILLKIPQLKEYYNIMCKIAIRNPTGDFLYTLSLRKELSVGQRYFPLVSLNFRGKKDNLKYIDPVTCKFSENENIIY